MAGLRQSVLKLPRREPISRRDANPGADPDVAVCSCQVPRLANAHFAMNSRPATAPQMPLDHAAVRTIVLGILLAMLLGALDQTIVATALPTIGRDLRNVEDLSWVVTAYLLTATAVTPIYGKLSDIHGRRAMLLIAIVLFCLGSIASALAPSMAVLILGRGFQGLGGGGLLSLSQTIIADVVPPLERGRYQ